MSPYGHTAWGLSPFPSPHEVFPSSFLTGFALNIRAVHGVD